MKKYLDLHRFFVTRRRDYMAPWTWKKIIAYPIAYCRFMYFSFKD